jgi:alpha-ketoglutarate-dependent taurine dioxygenase
LHLSAAPSLPPGSWRAFRGEEQLMPSFAITPLTDHTGAEVIGLDFTRPIDIETRAALNRAFAERHVLVMRDQHFTQSSSGPLRSYSASFSRTTRKSAMSPATPTWNTFPMRRS